MSHWSFIEKCRQQVDMKNIVKFQDNVESYVKYEWQSWIKSVENGYFDAQFRAMWQTKYSLSVPKNLGLRINRNINVGLFKALQRPKTMWIWFQSPRNMAEAKIFEKLHMMAILHFTGLDLPSSGKQFSSHSTKADEDI